MSENYETELQKFSDNHRIGAHITRDASGRYALSVYGCTMLTSNDPARIRRRLFDIAVSQMAYCM